MIRKSILATALLLSSFAGGYAAQPLTDTQLDAVTAGFNYGPDPFGVTLTTNLTGFTLLTLTYNTGSSGNQTVTLVAH